MPLRELLCEPSRQTKQALDIAKKFFDDAGKIFDGKNALITEVVHSSDSDKNLHVTVDVTEQDFEDRGGQRFEKATKRDTYWFWDGKNSYWIKTIHIYEDDRLNEPTRWVQITKEMRDRGFDIILGNGQDTYWETNPLVSAAERHVFEWKKTEHVRNNIDGKVRDLTKYKNTNKAVYDAFVLSKKESQENERDLAMKNRA